MDGIRTLLGSEKGTVTLGFSRAVGRTVFLLLLLFLPGGNSLGSMSSLAAVSSQEAEVCGIRPGTLGGTIIDCWTQSGGLRQLTLGDASFVGVSGGSSFFCALRRWTLQPYCWNSSTLEPRRLSSANYTAISVGESHVCGIRATDLGIDCWRGQVQSPPAGLQVSNISSGSNFTCGILVNRTVVCWGDQELSSGLQKVESSPFAMIQAGYSHACGLYSAFGTTTYCWGDNSYNQTDFPEGVEFSDFGLGTRHSCGLSRVNRTAICWGDNSRLQLAAPGNVSFDSITAGDFYTCGVTTGSLSVVCWGGPFGSFSALGGLVSLPGICTGSPCMEEMYELVNSTGQVNICGTFSQHVCVSCSKCPNSAFESVPCGLNGDRQCTPSASEVPSSPPAPTVTSGKGGKKLSNVEIVSIVLGSTGMLLGLIAVGSCLWGKLRKRETSDTRIHHSANAQNGSVTVSQQQQFRRQRSGASNATVRSQSRRSLGRADAFTLNELALATDNFSEENRIGYGSFGSVYRGVLADGREVAIKRGGIGSSNVDAAAKKKFQDKETAFQSELEFLTRLHHRHLVTLVGFCSEEEERLLVYDYMPNGTVHDHLHGRKQQRADEPPLPKTTLGCWKIRISVALQAARGIDYLHTYAVPPIIHRDIKSSNILLDADFSARVSDFGLSLMGPSDEESHLSMTAAGTVGYMDPEYYRLQHLTTKSDVYSFGVVLLELLTGKRAIILENKTKLEMNPQLPVNVVDYAVPFILEGQLLSVLDPRLKVPEQGSDELEAVTMLAELAEQCVRLEGRERPSMGEIVTRLETAAALLNRGSGSDSDRKRKKKMKMKLLQQLSRSRSATTTDSSGEIREIGSRS